MGENTSGIGSRLKVNGVDLGRIKGDLHFVRDPQRNAIGWNGHIVRTAADDELHIDTDAMMLAGAPTDELLERLEFAEKMIVYLRATVSQHTDKPIKPTFVPSRIRLAHPLRGDWPVGHNVVLPAGDHECVCNQWGAMSVRICNDRWLGIKQDECEILAFRLNAWAT